MKKVTAYGYPRLHWSLVDMAAASKRMFGGFGIAINAYPTVAVAEPEKELCIETNEFIEERTKHNLILALQTAKSHGLNINCKLHIQSNVKQHIGFGSSTQIILTAMDAINSLNNWCVAPKQIIEMSGRGRVSLISWSTHYYGGFCIDAGQPYNPKSGYLPSHTPGNRKPSTFIGSWDFPEEWKISLLGESLDVAMPPENENVFMNTNAPIDKQCGVNSIIELYHGILPSIIEKDYTTFATSLNYIQCIGWNSIEMPLQQEKTLSALQMLWERNFAVAISSFGPLLSVIHFENETPIIMQLAKECGLSYSGPYNVIQKRDITSPYNPFIQVDG